MTRIGFICGLVATVACSSSDGKRVEQPTPKQPTAVRQRLVPKQPEVVAKPTPPPSTATKPVPPPPPKPEPEPKPVKKPPVKVVIPKKVTKVLRYARRMFVRGARWKYQAVTKQLPLGWEDVLKEGQDIRRTQKLMTTCRVTRTRRLGARRLALVSCKPASFPNDGDTLPLAGVWVREKRGVTLIRNPSWFTDNKKITKFLTILTEASFPTKAPFRAKPPKRSEGDVDWAWKPARGKGVCFGSRVIAHHPYELYVCFGNGHVESTYLWMTGGGESTTTLKRKR